MESIARRNSDQGFFDARITGLICTSAKSIIFNQRFAAVVFFLKGKPEYGAGIRR